MNEQPCETPRCEEHHWVSHHQSDLPLYWIDQCSICNRFNAERMVEEIKRAGFKKPRRPLAWGFWNVR